MKFKRVTDMYAPYESEEQRIELDKMPPEEEIEKVYDLARANDVNTKEYRLFVTIVQNGKTYEF